MMKSLIVFGFILLNAMGLMARDFELVEFRVLHKDFKAEMSPVMDIDGQVCAALRVECDNAISIGLDQKVYKVEEIKAGEYYFYITYKEKKITFKSPNHNPLTVDVPDNGLIMGKVYYVRLKSVESADQTPKAQQVLIASNPDGAKIILNGEEKGLTSKAMSLMPGQYEIYLSKSGYALLKQMIVVKNQSENVFNFTLTELPKENQPLSNQNNTQNLPDPPSGNWVVTMNGNRFELLSIVRQNDESLLCKFTVTRLEQDLEMSIYREYGEKSTRLFDNNGAEYIPYVVKAANKSVSGGYLTHRFVNNIVTPVSMLVKDADRNAASISLFEFSVYDDSNQNYKVSFRNIPIQ